VSIHCQVLGPLSVTVDCRRVHLGGPKQRLLLALLLCRPNASISVDELTDALWVDSPPRTARKNVQVYVSKLRKIFGSRLTWSNGGYQLAVTPAECDVLHFDHLASTARTMLRNGDPEAAVAMLADCVALWRGSPLVEFANEPVLAAELERLTERFLGTLEDWAELEVERGTHHAVLERADEFARRYPLRERLAAVWIRALAAAGRLTEALAHYDVVRRALAGELGIGPGGPLAELHRRLLRREEVVAPPRRSFEAPCHCMPRDLPDFLDRTEEFRRVADGMTGGPGHDVVVVTGQIGVGKSTFAVHVARLLATSFPDGRIVLNMVGSDGVPKSWESLLDELLCMIGLSPGGPAAVPRSLATWRSWVARRRVLLVLDGAEHEDEVRPLLPADGRSRVIVTSRRALSGLEAVLRVELPTLTGTQGTALLERVIGHERMSTDRAAAHGIVACCAGLPLAIRITGARLSVLRHVRLADFLNRVRKAPSLLDEMVTGDLDLRSRYEHHCRTLAEIQRLAYRQVVAISPPPFSHGALMAALAELARPEAVLESLIDCGLLAVPRQEVTAHLASYDMPAFAYLYGRELVAAAHRRQIA
jgi:DNA-binding SARP family transcriptional activator